MKKLLLALVALVLFSVPALAEQRYVAGQYKTGVDLPAGEYVVLATSSNRGYFSISTDANGDEIVFNGVFDVNSIITVEDGEYVELTRCSAVPIDTFYATETLLPVAGSMLLVGRDIEPGEYKAVANEGDRGYYCIYASSRQQDIIANDVFENSTYLEVKDGQYLELARCSIPQN